jgi:hypothetical protein
MQTLRDDEATARFFAYGIFRPGEIAYVHIADFVERVQAASVTGSLRERDGIHLLDPRGEDSVRGDLLDFHSGSVGNAFEAIDSLEPTRTYRWDICEATTSSGTYRARVLVGRSPDRGSHAAAEPYRSRDDPMFVEALNEVSAALWPGRDRNEGEINDFFRYQMAYLLLWTSIERYCTLRWGFGLGPAQRVKRLASEPAFVSALRRHVGEERTVFRADKPTESPERLDSTDPEGSIGFYYQVRSNIAHRGKSIHVERQLVRDSLEQLTAIFSEVLDETLGQRSPDD